MVVISLVLFRPTYEFIWMLVEIEPCFGAFFPSFLFYFFDITHERKNEFGMSLGSNQSRIFMLFLQVFPYYFQKGKSMKVFLIVS